MHEFITGGNEGMKGVKGGTGMNGIPGARIPGSNQRNKRCNVHCTNQQILIYWELLVSPCQGKNIVNNVIDCMLCNFD